MAYDNIHAFHAAQASLADVDVQTMPGVRCRRVSRPIGAVGLYVPGGTAVLPSTALMLAVPAKIAGCETVVLATPPTKDGAVVPEVLYVAKKAGVTHILQAGGAQAIAALGHGTETCPKVDKIFGPGNQFVTAAKMTLQNSDAMVAIDMPAGPSEVLVVADAGAPPAHVAADLLSQAEHGPDCRSSWSSPRTSTWTPSPRRSPRRRRSFPAPRSPPRPWRTRTRWWLKIWRRRRSSATRTRPSTSS